MTPIPLGILDFPIAAAGDFSLLETTNLTSSSSWSFTGLDTLAADYQHLQIRMTLGVNSGSTANPTQYIRFNNDSGSNYAWHNLNGDGSSVSSNNGTSQTYIRLDDSIGGNAAGGIFSAIVLDILDFASTTKNTTVRGLWATVNTGEYDIFLGSGLYQSTNAITRIDQYLTADAGRVSLYGIKGA